MNPISLYLQDMESLARVDLIRFAQVRQGNHSIVGTVLWATSQSVALTVWCIYSASANGDGQQA